MYVKHYNLHNPTKQKKKTIYQNICRKSFQNALKIQKALRLLCSNLKAFKLMSLVPFDTISEKWNHSRNEFLVIECFDRVGTYRNDPYIKMANRRVLSNLDRLLVQRHLLVALEASLKNLQLLLSSLYAILESS